MTRLVNTSKRILLNLRRTALFSTALLILAPSAPAQQFSTDDRLKLLKGMSDCWTRTVQKKVIVEEGMINKIEGTFKRLFGINVRAYSRVSLEREVLTIYEPLKSQSAERAAMDYCFQLAFGHSPRSAETARPATGATMVPLKACQLLSIDDLSTGIDGQTMVLNVSMRNQGDRVVNATRAEIHMLKRTSCGSKQDISSECELLVSDEHNVIPIRRTIDGNKTDQLDIRLGFSEDTSSCLLDVELLINYNNSCEAKYPFFLEAIFYKPPGDDDQPRGSREPDENQKADARQTPGEDREADRQPPPTESQKGNAQEASDEDEEADGLDVLDEKQGTEAPRAPASPEGLKLPED